MENGQCLDMPLEEEPFAAEVKMNGYPVAEAGGLVWGYLGPLPAPLVPDWAPFSWQDGLTQVVYTDLPCNWLQCQESALDPIAVEWLQAYSPSDGQMAPPPTNLEFEIEEFEHGYVYKRKDGEAWNVGRTALWPNGMFAGDEHSCRLEWHVPIDETHTRVFMRYFDKAAPGTRLPKQRSVSWYAQICRTRRASGSPTACSTARSRSGWSRAPCSTAPGSTWSTPTAASTSCATSSPRRCR